MSAPILAVKQRELSIACGWWRVLLTKAKSCFILKGTPEPSFVLPPRPLHSSRHCLKGGGQSLRKQCAPRARVQTHDTYVSKITRATRNTLCGIDIRDPQPIKDSRLSSRTSFSFSIFSLSLSLSLSVSLSALSLALPSTPLLSSLHATPLLYTHSRQQFPGSKSDARYKKSDFQGPHPCEHFWHSRVQKLRQLRGLR